MIDFTDEQKMVRQAVRAWAEKELAPLVPRMERGELLPYETLRAFVKTFQLDEMARSSFAKVARSAEKSDERPHGGLGDPGLAAMVTIELTRICPGFMLSFGASLGLCGGAILAKGTAAQRERWALPVLTADKIGCWGMTEPGAGSDAFGSMRTVARKDGDGYVLSGAKTFITNAPHADTLIVYAKITDANAGDLRQRPIAAFVLERGMPGLTTSAPMEKMGMCSSPTGEIFLDEVRVDKSHLLGEREPGEGSAEPEGGARRNARDVLHSERTTMVPMAFGIIDRSLDVALAYARERESWGRKIAEYQLVQDKLARIYVAWQNVRNLLFYQLERAALKQPISATEASAGKLYAARAATEAALDAIQVLGGNGYMRAYPVEMLMRDAKLLQIGGGTDDIQILAVARGLITQTA